MRTFKRTSMADAMLKAIEKKMAKEGLSFKKMLEKRMNHHKPDKKEVVSNASVRF